MKASLLATFCSLALFSNAQWTAIPTGTINEFESVVVLDNDSYIVAGENGAAFRTDDGGSTWSSLSGLGNETVRDFLRLDAQTILGASDGFVVRSTDNGTSWTIISVPAPDDLHALARYGSTVIGVGRDGGIVRSDDLGLSWVAQVSGTTERLFCVWAFSPTEMLAAGRNGVAVRTTNGSTWVPATIPGGDDWVGIRFLSSQPNEGLICGEDGTLLRSADSGATWTPVSTGSTMGLSAIASEDDHDLYIAGSTGTALHSTDMGQTWTSMSSSSVLSMNDVDVWNGVAVMCGINGEVLKLGGTGGGIGMDEHDALMELHAWPVPANDRLFIDLSALSGGVELEVRTTDGHLVRSARGAATNMTVMELQDLVEGQYMLLVKDRSGKRARVSLAVVH